jgi:demethylmenaquinone methyltransferase / 2-methoxy-6-polyprenyl-1,4-benzoquinol methylase
LHLPFGDNSVDAVSCGFGLRNFVELPGFFDEVARVVRPGGRVGFLDAYSPLFPPLRWGHTLYFGKIVPRIGRWMSGNRGAYEYLPRSVSYMPPPSEVVQQMESAGFREISRQAFLGGAAHAFFATAS